MDPEETCLRWNKFDTVFSTAFCELQNLCDVTLLCNDGLVQAHKVGGLNGQIYLVVFIPAVQVVLAACSPLLHSLLVAQLHHSTILLQGIRASHLRSAIDLMYSVPNSSSGDL